MTSTASQQNPTSAPNPSTTAAPSYASAAGATKKPTSTPLSPNPSLVVGGAASSASAPQNGKPVSASPVNGRPNITPAVPVSAAPAVVHGSSSVNGASNSHTRKGSVTISANAPSSHIANGGPVGGPRPGGIQFGYNSPAVAHSTPQPSVSAPIPIPGNSNPRIASPAHSPSPIPIPSATGGRPPSSAPPPNQMTFGSFPGEGDRLPKQPPVPQNPLAMGHQQAGSHFRRDSQASAHGEMNNNGGHGPTRGNYQGQGGRGGSRNFTTGPYGGQPNMGYPPNSHNQRYAGPNAGRGGMQYTPNRNSMGPFPNSPQPPRASPAPVPAVPHQGTPNMSQAVPIPPQGFYPTQHMYQPQVFHPFLQTDSLLVPSVKPQKKKGNRRDFERSSLNNPRQPSSSFKQANGTSFYPNSYRRASTNGTRREELKREWNADAGGFSLPPPCPAPTTRVQNPFYSYVPLRSSHLLPPLDEIDLSPESGTFEKLLTAKKQMGQAPQMGMGYGGPVLDPYGRPLMGYPYPAQQMPQYMSQPPQPSAAPFNQPYAGGQYGQGPPAAQPMSRNSSQVSEHRPTSSTGHNQTPMVVSTPQPRPTPPVAQAASRQPPKSKKIVIKDPSGHVLDFKNIKPPASPAAASQPSKTPPVVASTPTPPPKPSTPQHTRTDSTSTNKPAEHKTAEQVKNEFIERVRATAEGPSEAKPKEDDSTATAAAAEKAAAEKAATDKAVTDKAAAEKAAAEKAAADDKAKKDEEHRLEEERVAAEKRKAEEEAKAKEQAETEAKLKAEAEAKAKAEADAEAKSKAEADAKAAEKAEQAKEKPVEDPVDSEDEIERMIREMEEADARREKEQAEITAKKRAAAEEAKKLAEANKAVDAAENDRKLREQEREMERLEEERERQRAEKEAKLSEDTSGASVTELLAKKIEDLKLSDKKDSSASSVTERLANLNINAGDSSASASGPKTGGSDKARSKPAALNLVVPSKPVEAPQPSAALQSLKSARYLDKKELADASLYPSGFSSPNPAVNSAVARKNKSFKYDAQFLLQFQKVFTEQPSMEFGQQVKSLIGDTDSGSRSASTRSAGPGAGRSASKAGAAGAFPSQGAMGSFGAKTLPPGTTSAQRFEMSQGNMPRPGMGNPMASFGRPGAFPGPHQMSRTASSSNMGGIPNSPRQGSRRGGGSKRNDFGGNKDGPGAARNMPLTAGQDLKPIMVTASGWKPTSIGSKAPPPTAVLAAGGHLDPEMVQRKVKAALNKMTPEKFDKISDQILAIAGQSKNEPDGRTLRQVIQLTFEKATDEAHWASMYAKFCKRMLEMMSHEIRDENILDKNGSVVSGGALFRKYLLNRCQEEFERGWKVDLPEAPASADGEGKKPGEAALLSDEYYIAAAAKRRGLGLVQFIGELYKLGMLTERIMHECVRKLLEFQGIPDEAEIESLTKLLRTIGANLDNTEKGKAMMDAYFQRMGNIMELPDLPSRLKFMLLDIVDLRKAQWASKEANKGPKTLKEIQAEAEAAAAQKAAESARNNQRGPPGGRPQAGRGDARNFSAYNQALQNQIGNDDLKRLRGSTSRTASANVSSFGPTSMFNSRSNSGRRLAPGGGFGRPGEDSGASSRTGTPPTRDSTAHANAFALLADSADHPASPPSTNASPALTKAALASEEKKET